MKVSTRGFTIVELLIVIVVIAILATISIVAYNGIQQRANTAAVNDAAVKAKRLIESYIVANNSYPYTADTAFVCITIETSCKRNSNTGIAATASFDTAMANIGNLPRRAPMASDVRGGITYQYDAGRTVNGSSSPAILSYYLPGINSDCGIAVLSNESTSSTTTSTKYTGGNLGGTTQCIVQINGPGI